jgi:hypothetical protein
MTVIWICFVVLIDEPLYVVISMPFVLSFEAVYIDRVVQAFEFIFIAYKVLEL